MKIISNACRPFLFLLAALVTTSTAQAGIQYTVTDLGTLGGTLSSGIGINASGQVAGVSYKTAAIYHAFLWTSATPNGTTGTMKDLGTLGGSIGASSVGSSINGSGQVTGYGTEFGSHAFLYDGTMHDLGTLGGPESQGMGINDSGQVTGNSSRAGNAKGAAFLWTPATPNGSTGTMHDLGTLGGTFSIGNGINATGQVVGASKTIGDASSHAFVWTPMTPNGATGAMKDLGTLGGTQSIAYRINAIGQVTGFSKMTGDVIYHAFLYDGVLLDLGTLGGNVSAGHDINDSGHVVGESVTIGNAANHAFLYTGSSGMVDLNTLIDPSSGWELSVARGINGAGQITGHGYIGGETHAFLLTPVPEASTLILAGTGLGLCFVRRQRPAHNDCGNLHAIYQPIHNPQLTTDS